MYAVSLTHLDTSDCFPMTPGLYRLGGDVTLIYSVNEERTGVYVVMLAANPSLRRQGLATEMMQRFMEACAEANLPIVLHPTPGDASLSLHDLVEFYVKLGFGRAPEGMANLHGYSGADALVYPPKEREE